MVIKKTTPIRPSLDEIVGVADIVVGLALNDIEDLPS